MPLREVEATFTRSEMVMFSWRSQEQYWSFKSKINRHGEEEEEEYDDSEPYTLGNDEGIDVDKIYEALDNRNKRKKEPKPKRRKRSYGGGNIPQGLPDKFYNEHGEIDLRRVTGWEAHKYCASVGLKLPVIHKL